MSSQGADSADQLLHLIYRHLKENGYRKAAKVLKKHITQKETEVGATLYEIYSSWIKSLDGIGDIKQKSGLDSSPVRKSHLSDYAVERVDEVKPVKSEIFEKIEEPDSKPIIHDGSVSSFDKPVPTTVVTKFCKNSEDHLYLKDECDGDQLHTPTYHIDSVPPSVEKVTVPQEKELSITCDVVVDAGSSERELSRYSEEEEEKLQQVCLTATPEATAVKPSAAVAVVGEGQSSDNSKDSENEEEVPVHKAVKISALKPSKQIPAEGTATALLKSSQHTSSQAIATPKSCAAEKAESSGSESSYDLCSEEGTTQEQNIMVTPKAEPLSGSPNKASRVSAATPVKPNYTPGPTAAYSKTEENSNGEDVSESEDEIPPEQNADVTTKAKPLSEKTTAVRTSTPVKPSITPGPTTATSKTEDRSESDGKSESEEEIPVTQATFTTPTADTPSPTPAVATKGPSSDSSSEDAHSEDDMLAQVTSINSTARKSSSTSAAVAHKKITSDSSSEEFHRAQVAPAMKTAVITPKRHEDDDSIDHTTSTTKSTVEVLVPTKRGTSAITNETRMKKEHSKSKGPVATSGHPRDERENLGCLKSEEEAEEETPVSASDALPKMECKATIQVLQKSSKPFKKVAGGSEDLSNVETTLTSLKTHKAKLCAITPEFSSSDMKNSYTKDDEGPASISVQGVSADSLPVIISVVTLSDAAPKRSKDSIVEELICQTSVDPKDTLKTVAEGRRKKNKKKKKKKKVSALPEEKEIPCIGPAQELLLQNGGTSISLDKLITEAQKASKQPVMEQSKDGVSLKKAGSKSSEVLVSEVNSEEETGLKTEAAAAIPRAIKRKTSEGKADSVSKSKKKKRVDTEGNTAEPSKDPHFEKYLSLEESKETQALSDDATSVMDLGGSIESKSTTLILSVKALKNIKKKIKKNNKDKEKVKVRDKGSKKNKTTLNMEKGIKTKSAFSSVGLASNWSATKKDLKKVAAIKRLPLALDTHLLDEQRDLQKKKKSDKDSIINSEPQPETRSVKKKNKSNTNKNNPSGKKETEDREDNELQNPGVEQSAPLKKKKKKKKNKLKNKEMNIPFNEWWLGFTVLRTSEYTSC
ncbi:treacle protein-like isoform X5 [Arapaima gigas]